MKEVTTRMKSVNEILAEELGLRPAQVENALRLRSEGGTIPFIARYRKEQTGEMNEIQLRDVFDRCDYLTELGERKATILKSIEEQGRLTDDLREQIAATMQKTELEDLYRPFRPKKRTRASVARERGLAALADLVRAMNVPSETAADPEREASRFINSEKRLPRSRTPLPALRTFWRKSSLTGRISATPSGNTFWRTGHLCRPSREMSRRDQRSLKCIETSECR